MIRSIKQFGIRSFIMMLSGATIVGWAGGARGAVEIKDSGEQAVHRKNENRKDWVKREIVLSNDQAHYAVQYDRYLDHDGKIGRDPSVSPVQVNNLYSAPWFTFNVTSSKGLTLAKRPFEVELLQGQIDRKGVALRWDTPQGKVEMRLILRDQDPNLYGQITVEGTDADTITFSTAPGGYCPTPASRDRWVIIADKDQQHAKEPIPLAASGSFLLYDKTLDPASNAHGHGAAGWVWHGATGDKVQFTCGEYTSPFRIVRSAADKPFQFAFRSYLNRPNAEAKSDFEAHAEETLKRLESDAELFEVAKKISIIKPGSQGN